MHTLTAGMTALNVEGKVKEYKSHRHAELMHVPGQVPVPKAKRQQFKRIAGPCAPPSALQQREHDQHGEPVPSTAELCMLGKLLYDSDEDAVELTRRLFDSIPMRQVNLDRHSHDVHTAYVSHISHISSFALALTVLEKEQDEDRIFELASGGFSSTVRLAKSSPDMWIPIFRQNRDNVLDVLDEHINQLARFRSLLIKKDFETFYKLIEESNQIRKILSS